MNDSICPKSSNIHKIVCRRAKFKLLARFEENCEFCCSSNRKTSKLYTNFSKYFVAFAKSEFVQLKTLILVKTLLEAFLFSLSKSSQKFQFQLFPTSLNKFPKIINFTKFQKNSALQVLRENFSLSSLSKNSIDLISFLFFLSKINKFLIGNSNCGSKFSGRVTSHHVSAQAL